MAHGRASVGALLMALILAACGGSSGGNPDRPRTGSPEPIDALPRALTASESEVIGASSAFGLELAARVAAADMRENVVISPLGASMALGMALNGANGTTFDGMRAALGFGSLTQEQINGAYRDSIDLLAGLDPTVRFELANAVWTDEGAPFHDAFFRAVTAAFDARAEERDFGDPATVTAINAWVEEHTNGMIDRIVDSLDPALVMLLVNAIYFEGAWSTQFDPADTRRRPFTREDGSTADVDMMSLDGVDVRRAQGSTYAAVELPYGGEAFAMVIVLPSPGMSARDWLAALDAETWAALTGALVDAKLDLLSIPKFTLTYDVYLNDALMALGMEAPFRAGADFTRMSPLGDQMCIDFVRQKTRIEVDERGTRAVAATAVGIGVTSFSSFVADRPFVFVIRERLSGAVLFAGFVGDPTAEDPGAGRRASDCTGALLQ